MSGPKLLSDSTIFAAAQTSETAAISAKANSSDLAAPSGAGLIGYLGIGPNAVARDVAHRLHDTYSVKDYGVVGDGVADDTVAINHAIATVAGAGGGDLDFPAGTYLISGSLNMAAGVSLHGKSRGQTIIKCVTNGVTMLSFLNINTYGLRVSGMTISGVNGSTGTVGVLVSATLGQSSHMVFRDVQFLNHAKGLANGGNYGLSDSQYDSCDFVQCTTWGLEVAGSGISGIDCKFRQCGWGSVHSYLNSNSIAGVGYVNCAWISNNVDVALNGVIQRSTSFQHCRFEQCATAVLGSFGGTHFLHSTTFKTCVFQPGATSGGGVVSLPAASLTGLLAFDSCTVFTSLYAGSIIPSSAQIAASVANSANFNYSRSNCMSSDGTASGTTPYGSDYLLNTSAAIISTLGFTPFGSLGGTLTGPLVLNADPTQPLGAATKQYVDAFVQGVKSKTEVAVASTANLTLSGLQTIDGYAVQAGDRVLAKDQTAQTDNGIYVAAAGAWTRATDADLWSELAGAMLFVYNGTINNKTTWVCNIGPTGTVGSTAITFAQFSAAGSYSAGTGLQLIGNQFSLANSAALSIRGNNTGSAGSPVDLTVAQVKAMLSLDLVQNLSAASILGGLTSAQVITALTFTPVASNSDFSVAVGGTVTSASKVDAVGYKGLPQNAQTAAYTLVLGDMGKHISSTTGGWAIPDNSVVAFPIGTTIVLYNDSAVSQTVLVTTDTLRLAGSATTGSRTVAQRGLATILKVHATEWVISGAGVS